MPISRTVGKQAALGFSARGYRNAVLCLLLAYAPALVLADSTPWLDIPASWQRSVEDGVVALVPGDLPSQSSFLMLIESATTTDEAISASYTRALSDLGPWTAAGDVQEVAFENGWIFRYGIGITHLDEQTYTAETAVARHGNQLVRFWVLADSDDTFNRYKDAIGNAIASVQDSTAIVANTPTATPAVTVTSPGPSFGAGDSGVYLGIERGLSAGAGFGQGSQQVFNQSTGQYENSTTGSAPAVQLSVSDYQELDVLFPDGSFRRSMPARGLASDLAWDRANFPSWWGTWSRTGDVIATDRGGYQNSYRVVGNELVSERGRPWVKLPLPDHHLQIDGSYARDDYREASAPRLVMHSDGRYEDRGDFLRMVGSAANLVVPDGYAMLSRWSDDETRRAMAGGNGKYSSENFTLTFTGDDGRVWQFGFYLSSTATMSPPELTLGSYRLIRD